MDTHIYLFYFFSWPLVDCGTSSGVSEANLTTTFTFLECLADISLHPPGLDSFLPPLGRTFDVPYIEVPATWDYTKIYF